MSPIFHAAAISWMPGAVPVARDNPWRGAGPGRHSRLSFRPLPWPDGTTLKAQRARTRIVLTACCEGANSGGPIARPAKGLGTPKPTCGFHQESCHPALASEFTFTRHKADVLSVYPWVRPGPASPLCPIRVSASTPPPDMHPDVQSFGPRPLLNGVYARGTNLSQAPSPYSPFGAARISKIAHERIMQPGINAGCPANRPCPSRRCSIHPAMEQARMSGVPLQRSMRWGDSRTRRKHDPLMSDSYEAMGVRI